MGAVAGPSGRVGFASAHCLTMSMSATLAVTRGCGGVKIFSRINSRKFTPAACRESQGARSKWAERVFVPCDQAAPAAQARRPLRESLPPSLRSSNESAGLQGYGFTLLRSPKFLGETNASGRTFLSEVKCAPKLTGLRRKKWSGRCVCVFNATRTSARYSSLSPPTMTYHEGESVEGKQKGRARRQGGAPGVTCSRVGHAAFSSLVDIEMVLRSAQGGFHFG